LDDDAAVASLDEPTATRETPGRIVFVLAEAELDVRELAVAPDAD
jgi:hypothetical protein